MNEKKDIQPKPPSNSLAQHYNQAYRENPAIFGGGKPETFVLYAAGLISPGGKVIELGAGQGRNALALAEKGLQVTAVDISKIGVDLMNTKARELGFSNFRAKIGDSREATEGEYDLVVSTFMLHHLSREDAEKLIVKIKEHTKSGGINAIVTFTAEGDFARSPNAEGRFYPSLGEMRELYKDWEIVKYTEEKSEAKQTKPDGGSMFNIQAEIIARKL
ncbi:MAG: methyltransferase domain-containing protein [Candidatus Colwellbacteria bacterium]|nr:methyltransferase domain-containing protein [Candidatus Colwellbacteria bacterium]